MPAPTTSTPESSPPQSSAVLGPDALRGAWWRSFLTTPTTRDTTSSVLWLQGPGLFGDLRQRPDVLALSGAGGLRDLTPLAVGRLAHQEAFAGPLLARDGCVEWGHAVDLQPPTPERDVGRLHVRAGTLVEEGVHATYEEHWHLRPGAATPCTGLSLREHTTGRPGVLVRVGPWFLLARGRRAPLDATPGARLPDLVRDAPTLAAAQDLVDCEVSWGRTDRGRGWVVERSSLPFRVGTQLDPRPVTDAGRLHVTETSPDHVASVRHWDVLTQEGDPL